MVYIAIPKGWTFIKADVANSKDRLVDESGKQIVIQELVKDALQHVVRGTSSINGNTKNTHGLKVTIYFRRPPDTLEEFLMYKPTKNGNVMSNGKISGEKRLLIVIDLSATLLNRGKDK